MANTARSPTFTSHAVSGTVSAAALERACAGVPQLRKSSTQAAALNRHPIVNHVKAAGGCTTYCGASFVPFPLRVSISKPPEIEADTVSPNSRPVNHHTFHLAFSDLQLLDGPTRAPIRGHMNYLQIPPTPVTGAWLWGPP